MKIQLNSDLLAGVYLLPHRASKHDQSESSCNEYLQLFASVLEPLWKPAEEGDVSRKWWTEEDLSRIGTCRAALEGSDPAIKRLEWFPKYGSAVVAYSFPGQLPGTLALSVLGLDPHKLSLHPSNPGESDSYDYLGRASDFVALAAGRIHEKSLPEVMDRFHMALSEAQQEKGEKRSAGSNKQGHQFTPAMISAVLLEAVTRTGSKRSPKGGFTDCGIHTGGHPRNTSYPLARSFLHWILKRTDCSESTTFLKVMLYFDLRIVEEGLEALQAKLPGEVGWKDQSHGLLRQELDSAMTIMVEASLKCKQLYERNVDLRIMLDVATRFELKIKSFHAKLQDDEVSQYTFGDIQSELQAPGAFRNPVLNLDPTSPWSLPVESLGDVDALTKQNIGLVHLFEPSERFDWSGLLNWTKARKSSAMKQIDAAWLLIRTTEQFFWSRAEGGLANNLEPLDSHGAVFEVIEVYRTVIYNYSTKLDASYRRKTELYSRELLLTWIGYCIIFAAVRTKYACLSNMGVCLRYQDLEHLVLSEKRLWSIAHLVIAFLASNVVHKAELFSLRFPTSTTRAGEEFAKHHLQEVERLERSDAETRSRNYWKEITELKAVLSQLREDLASQEERKSAIMSAKGKAQQAYEMSLTFDRQGRACHGERELKELNHQKQRLRNINRDIDNTTQAIGNAKVAPERVIQPIPSQQSLTRTWLFFLHMPPPLRTLQSLSFLSQQLLAPRLGALNSASFPGFPFDDARSEMEVKALPRCSIVSHYNANKSSLYLPSPCSYRAAETLVQLVGEEEFVIPPPIEDLDLICSPSDGVFYPDMWRPRMAWLGGTSTDDCPDFEFDPFRISWKLSHLFLTETINPEDLSLQWTILQDGLRSGCRGNMPLARQSDKPSELATNEFLTLGKLRSFPFIQLRNLLAAVADDALPLDNVKVQKVVSQLTYHLGAVSHLADESFRWKADLYIGRFIDFAVPLFVSIANRLSETPTKHPQTIIVTELSSFFADWDTSGMLRFVAKSLAQALYKWSQEHNGDTSSSRPQIASSWTKESKESDLVPRTPSEMRLSYLQHAIICLASGHSQVATGSDVEDDFGEVIRLTVLYRNWSSFDAASHVNAAALDARCAESLNSRVDQILLPARQRSDFLTQAVKAVVHGCPARLDWVEMESSCSSRSACFRAVANGTVYAINVLTGVVLVNGVPPSKLPIEIRESRLYKDVFGSTDFEVVQENGIFVTAVPLDGKTFSFRLSGKSLLVKEFDSHGNTSLELLDHRSINNWGSDLPTRLKQMYFFWATDDRSIVLLRDRNFRARISKYAVKLDSCRPSGSEVECLVYAIPTEQGIDTPLTISTIRSAANSESLDRLVIFSPGSNIMRILDKFEDRCYIHAFVAPCGTVRLDMPRYQLTLEHRGDSLQVREFKGVELSSHQLLKGTLGGFSRYLVLTERTCTEGPGHTYLLFPEGAVHRQSTGETLIRMEHASYHSSLQYHRLRVHSRYRTLHGMNTIATLRAAALHASTSMRVVDCLFGMKGSERALELVRQCFSTSPLSPEEIVALENVKFVCRGRFPAVRLACDHLHISSEQVSFLYRDMIEENFEPPLEVVAGNEDDISKYLLDVYASRCNPRELLTNEEMALCFGGSEGPTVFVPLHSASTPSTSEWLDAAAVSHASNQLEELEEALASLLSHHAKDSRTVEFPLPCPTDQNRLFQSIHAELRDSWLSYQLTKNKSSLRSPQVLDHFPRMLKSTRLELTLLESRIIAALDATLPARCLDDATVVVRFYKLCGILPSVARVDFTRALYNPLWISSVNPALPNAGRDVVIEGLLVWHRLCVLEDKLIRLCSLLNSADVGRELQVTRCFDVKAFPSWLAFEVEQQLQIRPEQALVAQHLLESPGDIVQLNMGLGKTRVIVPMLVLHWTLTTRDSQKRMMRLNVLTNLFHEGKDFFRSTLTGSIARIRVFSLPFCRDVVLDDLRLASLTSLLSQCQSSPSFFLTCPEHRLSLELKTVELHHAGKRELSKALLKDVHDTGKWREVLDESDELLHHRFRLIYATGVVEELPQSEHRFRMPQFVLHHLSSSPRLLEWIEKNSNVVVKGGLVNCECFRSVRINGRLFSDERRRELNNLLAEAILTNPPYELDWVKNHPALPDIRRYVTDPEVTDTLPKCFATNHRHDILVLRGLLAGNLLAACLQKRHRVDFGIHRGGEKRIAIPFRAADVPAARSEFAHPDCGIVLTCLAYYCDGLDAEQLAETFRELLALGKDSKARQYSAWFQLSKPRMGRDTDRIDQIDKIDLQNESQFVLLLEYFSRNVETINFYLRHIVLPAEMQYFPKRITATSWNLAENSDRQVVGFSGTNDNHRNLPLQVRQFFFDQTTATSTVDSPRKRKWLEVFGTNGMMVDRILEHTIACGRFSSSGSVASAILSFVERSKPIVGALIDAGALLAGVAIKDFASELVTLLKRTESAYRGVTFFDPATNKWSIMDSISGRCDSIDRASILVEETFAFFDEPRCRGADLKLQPDAVAILTLGPKMGKDKLMQGAGRMRKLGSCQKLVLVGTDEVMNQVYADLADCLAASTSQRTLAILDWALKNSMESSALGLLPWATQGCFHATSYGDPDLTVEPEQSSVRELYGSPFMPISTPSAVKATRRHYTNRRQEVTEQPLEAKNLATLEKISAVVNDLGCSVTVSASGLDDECERELELQREMEAEQEVEVPTMNAVHECDWDVSVVLSSSSADALPRKAGIVPIGTFVESLHPASLGGIAWPPHVFVTENFVKTVVDRTSRRTPSTMNPYLRLVDAGLVFPQSGHVLLLSEREADQVVELMYKTQLERPRPDASETWLFHLSFQRLVADGSLTCTLPQKSTLLGRPRSRLYETLPTAVRGEGEASDRTEASVCRETMSLTANRPERRTDLVLPDNVLACLQLFAGETAYGTVARKESLKSLLVTREEPHPAATNFSDADNFHDDTSSGRRYANDEPIHLVTMRGHAKRYPYSDLEEVCKELSREDEGEKYRLRSSLGGAPSDATTNHRE